MKHLFFLTVAFCANTTAYGMHTLNIMTALTNVTHARTFSTKTSRILKKYGSFSPKLAWVKFHDWNCSGAISCNLKAKKIQDVYIHNTQPDCPVLYERRKLLKISCLTCGLHEIIQKTELKDKNGKLTTTTEAKKDIKMPRHGRSYPMCEFDEVPDNEQASV